MLRLLIIWFIGVGVLPARAQDSTNRVADFFWGSNKPSTLNDTWNLRAEPEVRYAIDTSIFNIEEYNQVQRPGIEYATAGNMGAAAFPIVYGPARALQFNLGYNQFDVYKLVIDSARYYKVMRPYTELTMLFGLRNEQMFEGRFANRHKEMFSYGVHFRRLYSLGAYTNQRANNNGFHLYGAFHSKNQHWAVQADLIFNSHRVKENGGLTEDIFENPVFQKSLAPVNLTTAENRYRNIDFYLRSSYYIGKTYRVSQQDDTVKKKMLMPLFTVSHQLNVEQNVVSFRDITNPDEDYYGRFYNADSVFNDIAYIKVGNSLQLHYTARRLQGDSTYTEKNFTAFAEAGIDYYLLTQNLIQNNFANLYVGGTLRSNGAARSRIIYRGSVKYFPYGWNGNDFLADATAGYNFGKWGVLTGNFTFKRAEVPYMFERYTSHPVGWNYNLPKSIVTAAGGKYENTRWGITADAHYYFVSNLPVFPGSENAFTGFEQNNFVVIHAANRHGIKGFHIDNDVWITQPLDRGNITRLYAFLYTRHSLYYERRVFKKALWFSVGFDVRLRYSKTPPYYDPLLGSFYPSYTDLRFLPQLDFFLNAKIKTVRVFVKVDNLVSAMISKGYYSLHQYPAQDLSFRVGIRWRFFE